MMSVSSHLTPEPERRLWVIHDTVLRAAEWVDVQQGVLLVFLMLELPYLGRGVAGYSAVLLALAAILLALAGFSPLTEAVRQLPLLDQPVGKVTPLDSFLQPGDLARYPHIELVLRMDKYLGGGITATPYHEDIVARIIAVSRRVTRKRRLFAGACAAALGAQLLLAAALLF